MWFEGVTRGWLLTLRLLCRETKKEMIERQMRVFLHTESWMGTLLKRLVANAEIHSTSLNLLLPSHSMCRECKSKMI
jgi:hypothetical protein